MNFPKLLQIITFTAIIISSQLFATSFYEPWDDNLFDGLNVNASFGGTFSASNGTLTISGNSQNSYVTIDFDEEVDKLIFQVNDFSIVSSPNSKIKIDFFDATNDNFIYEYFSLGSNKKEIFIKGAGKVGEIHYQDDEYAVESTTEQKLGDSRTVTVNTTIRKQDGTYVQRYTHSRTFSGGEPRKFNRIGIHIGEETLLLGPLTGVPVPEPSSYLLAIIGLGMIALIKRQK